MREQQFKEAVLQYVVVSNPLILLAKQFLVSQIDEVTDTKNLLEIFTSMHGKSNPGTISFYDSPTHEQIKQTAQYISYGLAYCEAVWSLIHSGYYYGSLDRHYHFRPDIKYTHLQHNGSSNLSIIFDNASLLIPHILVIQFSKRKKDGPEFVLFNPEIYANEIGSNIHKDVHEALEDSISCFRQELYRPAVTLLGKAVEGAWVELGISLYNYADDQIKGAEKQKEKLKNESNFMNRIQHVISLYESRQDIFIEVIKQTGVKPHQLKEIYFWSDVVRDSRNAIHYGIHPKIPNTYEKTAVLLMSASSHLKTLYHLKNNADTKTFSSNV